MNMAMGVNPTLNLTSLILTPILPKTLDNFPYFGGGGGVGFEVGLGLSRIGVILWSFLVILTQILTQFYHEAYLKKC
jgi:hypothetical protein